MHSVGLIVGILFLLLLYGWVSFSSGVRVGAILDKHAYPPEEEGLWALLFLRRDVEELKEMAAGVRLVSDVLLSPFKLLVWLSLVPFALFRQLLQALFTSNSMVWTGAQEKCIPSKSFPPSKRRRGMASAPPDAPIIISNTSRKSCGTVSISKKKGEDEE